MCHYGVFEVTVTFLKLFSTQEDKLSLFVFLPPFSYIILYTGILNFMIFFIKSILMYIFSNICPHFHTQIHLQLIKKLKNTFFLKVQACIKTTEMLDWENILSL